MIFVSCLIPAINIKDVNAKSKLSQIQEGEKGKRLIVYNPETMTLNTFEWSCMIHGFTYTHDQRREFRKAEVKLFIDEVEIKLDHTKESEKIDGVKHYWLWFYETFDSGYFEPGIYNWTVIWYVDDVIYWQQSHPLTVLTNGHQIVVYNTDTMVIAAGERSFVRHGWTGVTETDYDLLQPFSIQVLLNGTEIPLYNIRDKTVDEPEPIYDLWFYQTFDANYFAAGGYNWTVIWSDNTGIVYNQTYRLTVVDNGHRINVFYPEAMIITEADPCFVRHGWHNIVDLNEILPARPYDTKLFIDDVEEVLQDQIWYTPENPTDVYQLYWFKHFNPYHFAPGEYDWRVEYYENEILVWEESHLLIVLEECHRLTPFEPESLYITTTQRTFVKHGYTFSDPTDFSDLPKITFELYIDGIQEDLYFIYEIDYSSEEPRHYYFFYQSFDSGYFAPGYHFFNAVWKQDGVIIFEFLYPFTVVEDGQRLSLLNQDTLIIRQSQRSYIQHGMGFGNLDNLYSGVPCDVQLFIEGTEYDLCKNVQLDFSDPEEVLYSYFYYINFEPNYFDIGEYEVRVLWTWPDDSFERIKTLYVIDNGHRIDPIWTPSSLTFTEELQTYYSIGIITTPELFDLLPVNLVVEIDGNPVDLQISYEIRYDMDIISGYFWRYYVKFEAYEFTIGWHDFRMIATDAYGVWFDQTYQFEVLPEL